MWIQTRGAKISVKLDKNLENSSISNRKKQFIGFFERIFSSVETVDKVSALLYVGCVLLGRVLQAAGRLSLDVRCVRLVSSSCSCLDQHLVFVAALGDDTLSTRGGNITLSTRGGACSLLLGGLARGFEVRVDLKLDRVARGARGLDVQLGRWLEQCMVSSTSKPAPCGCSSMERAAAI